MKAQHYKNHTQIIPVYHFVVFPILFAAIIGAIVNVIKATESNIYSASLILVLSIVVMFIFFFARIFALKAQDRAIRAEENFRHFMLTGKPLDPQLRLGQIIALRFASDEEMPVLAQKAMAEKMLPKDIKKAITMWRGDYHRV